MPSGGRGSQAVMAERVEGPGERLEEDFALLRCLQDIDEPVGEAPDVTADVAIPRGLGRGRSSNAVFSWGISLCRSGN